jgi:hypothetical protein
MPIEVIGTSGINSINDINISTGGTPRVVIKTSGNVGLGTSTPVAPLHVTTSGTSTGTVNSRTGLHIQTGNVTTGFGNSRIQFSFDPNTPKGYIEAGTFGTDYMAFGRGDGTGEAMRIDGAGRVTMPFQPIISLDGNFGTRDYTGTYTIVDFTPVVSRGGMSWNSTNGRVTVPVSGVYEINLHVYHYSIGSVRSQISINGGSGSLAQSTNTTTADETRSQTIIRTLAANDYVSFLMTGGTRIFTGNQHTFAHVKLIA